MRHPCCCYCPCTTPAAAAGATATADPILLDGWRQAAALDSGDVVAVRTEAEPVATFFGCYEQQMKVNPKDIYRPVMSSVLQVAWGVSDTALYWSQATGR